MSFYSNFPPLLISDVCPISAMMSALLKTEIDRTCIQEFIKASEKLGKLFDEAMIRSLVDGLSQKTASEMYGLFLNL